MCNAQFSMLNGGKGILNREQGIMNEEGKPNRKSIEPNFPFRKTGDKTTFPAPYPALAMYGNNFND